MRWHALARHAWWAGCAARSCSKQRGGWRCARAAKTACAARPDPGGRAARSVDPAYACGARRARTGQQPRAFCAGALRHGRIPAEAVAWPRRCARRGRASEAGACAVTSGARKRCCRLARGRRRAAGAAGKAALQEGPHGAPGRAAWASGAGRTRLPSFPITPTGSGAPTALRELLGCLSLPEESAEGPYKDGADTSVRLLPRAEFVGSQVPRL